jgi:hypothetical protein
MIYIQIMTAVAGIWSAMFWLISSLVIVPNHFTHYGNKFWSELDEFIEGSAKQSYFSRRAAIYASVAAILEVICILFR